MPLNQAIARFADRIGRLPRAYRDAFQSDAGVLVLRDLARECGVLEVATVAGDPYMTHFNDGKRAVFLHIAGKLRWNERDILRLSEAAAEQSADNASAFEPS